MARIITSSDDVPDGFVRITDLTDNATDAKILSDAHTTGHLDAVKLIRTTSEVRTGPVWVDAVAAKALLMKCQAKRDAAAPAARPSTEQTIDLTQYEAMRTLQRIEAAMLRIAEAAEAMATRPS